LEEKLDKDLEKSSTVKNIKYFFLKKLALISKKFKLEEYQEKFEKIVKLHFFKI